MHEHPCTSLAAGFIGRRGRDATCWISHGICAPHPSTPFSSGCPLPPPTPLQTPWAPHTGVCAANPTKGAEPGLPRLCNAERGTDSPRHSRSRLRAGFPPFPGLRSAPGLCLPMSKAAVTAPCLGFPLAKTPRCARLHANAGRAAGGSCSRRQSSVWVLQPRADTRRGWVPLPNPSVSPGSARAAEPSLAEPSVAPCCIVRPSARDGKLIRSL